MTRDLDTRLRAAAPIRDDAVAELDLPAERTLLDAIGSEPRRAEPRRAAAHATAAPATTAAPESAAPPRARRHRRRLLATAFAGAAAVAVLALAGVSLSGSGELRTGPERAWAAQALRVAGAVPRLAIGEPGWRVTAANEFEVDEGELQFAKNGYTAQLTWRPLRSHDDYVSDRAHGSRRLPPATIVGNAAAVFRYPGPRDDLTALWRDGRYSFEFRVTADSDRALDDDAFGALLRSLKLVGVDAWLGAMPPTVVLPDDRAATVRAMLRGIPLPPGFDAAPLSESGSVLDRYQLGAAVSGAVACDWIGRWVAARADGDAAASSAAAGAMATARDWPLLSRDERGRRLPRGGGSTPTRSPATARQNPLRAQWIQYFPTTYLPCRRALWRAISSPPPGRGPKRSRAQYHCDDWLGRCCSACSPLFGAQSWLTNQTRTACCKGDLEALCTQQAAGHSTRLSWWRAASAALRQRSRPRMSMREIAARPADVAGRLLREGRRVPRPATTARGAGRRSSCQRADPCRAKITGAGHARRCRPSSKRA